MRGLVQRHHRALARSSGCDAADRRVPGLEPQVSFQAEDRSQVDVDHPAVADGGDPSPREAIHDGVDARDDAGPEPGWSLAAELFPAPFDHRPPTVVARLAHLL